MSETPGGQTAATKKRRLIRRPDFSLFSAAIAGVDEVVARSFIAQEAVRGGSSPWRPRRADTDGAGADDGLSAETRWGHGSIGCPGAGAETGSAGSCPEEATTGPGPS